jgi:hypothetical protein
MKQAHVSNLFGLIAGTLIAGGGLQAQTTGPIDPTPPIEPPPSTLPWVGILATDPTALQGTSSGAFTLLVNAALPTNLPVTLALSGTSSNGVDYELVTNGVVMPTHTNTNVVVIPAGFLAVDILVQPISGAPNTGNKTVVACVVTNVGYQVWPGPGIYAGLPNPLGLTPGATIPVGLGSRRATVTIVDDIFNIAAPTVAITNPPDGSVFWFPAPITLGAEASDTGSSISSVSFFANDEFLGKATTSPYSVVWTNPWPGRFTLTALAFDAVGQSTLSAPVHIVVTNILPLVKLSSPTNDSNFILGEGVTMEADSSDSANPITNVTFYVNGRVVDKVAIPTTATSPYTNTFTWTPAQRGVYILQASVTDTLKNKVYSNRALINVSKP